MQATTTTTTLASLVLRPRGPRACVDGTVDVRRTDASCTAMQMSVRIQHRTVEVVHNASGVVERTLSFPTRVADAVITTFAGDAMAPAQAQNNAVGVGGGGKSSQAVCVLERGDFISIFAQSGDVFDVPLPFHASRIFEVTGGLLIQRSASSEASHGEHAVGRPRLFTLTHPLDEVKPVAISAGATPPQMFTDARINVAVVLPYESLVVALHSVDQSFCVYALQAVPASQAARSAIPNSVSAAGVRSRSKRSLRHKPATSWDDDNPMAICPARQLTLLWSGGSATAPLTSHRIPSIGATGPSMSAFAAHDVDGSLTVCVLDRSIGQLHIVPLAVHDDGLVTRRSNSTPARVVHCKDAIALSEGELGVGDMSACGARLRTARRDLVVLDNSGCLWLQCGERPMCALRVPDLREGDVVDRIHSVGQHMLAATYRRGEKRMSQLFYHPVRTLSSPFVAHTMDVLRWVVPPVKLMAIKIAVTSFVDQMDADVSSSVDTEWQAFSEFLIESVTQASKSKRGQEPMGDVQTSAFDRLCHTPYHQQYQRNHAILFKTINAPSFHASARSSDCSMKTEGDHLEELVPLIFSALHMVYEDMKLSTKCGQQLPVMAQLLHCLARRLGLYQFCAFYETDDVDCNPSDVDRSRPETGGITHQDPPSIFDWIFRSLRTSTTQAPFPLLKHFSATTETTKLPLWRTVAVCRIVGLWLDYLKSRSQQDLVRILDFLATETGPRLVDDLPFSVAVLIIEIIEFCREHLPVSVTPKICTLIGREDVFGEVRLQLIRSAPEQATSNTTDDPRRQVMLESNTSSSDGLAEMSAASQSLFRTDQRSKEVARLLRSSRPLCLKIEKASDVSDQDYVLQQQARLLLLCKRSMALPIARGMVTLGGFDCSLPQHHAWQLRVPPLPLSGRTPPTNAIVSLDVSGYAKELTHWPQFHNGCATALRLPARDLSTVVNRYWIKYHRPSQASRAPNTPRNASANCGEKHLDEAYAAHAGLLLGLGLRGHLKCLSMADVYNYLSISNEFVTVAILLGMAATAAQCRRERNQQHEEATTDQRENEADVSRELSFTQAADDELEEDQTPNLESFAAGSTQKLLSGVEMELTLERSVSKMLCLHIPSLLPPPFAEFSVPASTQTAALLGLGILYQGTGHRLMTELLLTEIIRSPSSSQFLGSSTNSGMSTTSFDQLKGYALAAGLALGLVTLGRGNSTSGDPGLADLKLEEKLYKYVVGGAHQFGDPGAAGSCMYRGRKWKSFGSSSGNGRSPPMSTAIGVGRATKLQTERHVRGEHVNIGVTGCGSALALGFMYMMTNNKSIASQLAIPDTLTLLDYVRPDILLIRTLAKNLVMWDEIEPTQSWIYETEMPKQLKEAFETLSSDSDLNTSSLPPTADIGSICEAHANIAAAAAFSIGLRFAGTANSKAREALRKMFMHFRDLRSKMALVTRDLVAANTERVTVERSLTLCAQAMALVDGGTGNVETLKLLRSINLRQRVDSELTYGNHMGQSMAIGLLFIGGGRATILRTREAIAALVISLYPMAPMNTADNKYHLQAFRHLYVLAVDTSRLVETVDVDTGSSCSAELRVEVANSVDDSPEWRTFKTPCLLPDLETVKAIVIESGSYYPVRIIVSAGNNMSDESDELHSPANVARLQLLRQKNMVLLKAHQQTEPLPVFATTPAIDRAVVMTLDGLARPDERLMAGFQQYFVRPATSSGTNAPISAWWREQCKEWVLRRSTKTCNFTLPWNMNLLQAVFRLHHLPLDSAWELRNVKLLQMHWGSCESSLVELNMQERDDRFWIKTEADEALRALIDTSVIPRVVNDPSRESVASIVRILNRQGQLSRQDVFLVTALLDYFDGRDLFQLQTPGGNVPSRFSLQEFLASSTRSPYDKQVWLAIASFILFSV